MSTDETPKTEPASASGEETTFTPPLFYDIPAPVSPGTHGDFKIRPEADFSFAKCNAIPITVPEFVLAARHYPIVFLGEELVPTVALGFDPEENFFVDEDGTWDRGCYIPAYVRRYPFILLGRDDDERLQLGIDNKAKSDKPDARALFENGKETETVNESLGLCQQFHGAYLMTSDLSKMLLASDLMENRNLELDTPDGKVNLGSFSAVNEQKLRETPDETFLEWRKEGWLPALYFHLASLNNWEGLIYRASQRHGTSSTPQT